LVAAQWRLRPARGTDSLPGTTQVVHASAHPRPRRVAEYKFTPLKKAGRYLLGYAHPRGVYSEQAIGISTEEFTRAKDSGLRFLRNVFPR
jgi:hypothetical protein